MNMTYNKAMKVTNHTQDARDILWDSERDAETLAEAKAIATDSQRMLNATQAAVKVVQRRAENIERERRRIQELSNLAAVAEGKGRPVNIPKVQGANDFPNEIITPKAFGLNQIRALDRLTHGR